MLPKTLVLGILALALLSLPVVPTTAKETAAPQNDPISSKEAVLKVNVAGRQRMLSQRIAKSACLMSGQIDYDRNATEMQAALAEFETAHQALIDGDPNRGLTPERIGRVNAALGEVKGDWVEYRPYVMRASDTGRLSTDELVDMVKSSNVVLTSMNSTVGLMARSYADAIPSVSVAMTITVDIAGRQRMLTQKMVKEMCAGLLTGDASYLEAFRETYEIFDLSLNALQNGMPEVGVLAPPNPAVADKLGEVAELWAQVRPTAEMVAGGELPSAQMLAEFAVAIEPVLVTMNEAVGLYGK